MLFGTRGKAPVLFKGQPTWGFYPLGKHSEKPLEQYAVIERVSPPEYLELFARRKHSEKWDVWGNEVASDITIPGYPVPKLSERGQR
jgi:N6-adenosine-specific RNA methylase IME4